MAGHGRTCCFPSVITHCHSDKERHKVWKCACERESFCLTKRKRAGIKSNRKLGVESIWRIFQQDGFAWLSTKKGKVRTPTGASERIASVTLDPGEAWKQEEGAGMKQLACQRRRQGHHCGPISLLPSPSSSFPLCNPFFSSSTSWHAKANGRPGKERHIQISFRQRHRQQLTLGPRYSLFFFLESKLSCLFLC